MFHPTASADDHILRVIRRAGGTVTMELLAREFPVDRKLLAGRLRNLIVAGLVEEGTGGLLHLARDHLGLGLNTCAVIEVLESARVEAHVSGLDIVASYARGPLYWFPHIVYCESDAFEETVEALGTRNYVITRRAPRWADPVPDLNDIVVLNPQPKSLTYGVRSYVAPVEKAWTDLLCECLRHNVSFDYAHLGRMLRNLLDCGADEERLRTYARRAGCLDRVDGALTGEVRAGQPEIELVRRGVETADAQVQAR